MEEEDKENCIWQKIMTMMAGPYGWPVVVNVEKVRELRERGIPKLDSEEEFGRRIITLLTCIIGCRFMYLMVKISLT